MPITHEADAVVHTMHGARFTSFVAPSSGSEQLCAWRLDLPAGTTGVAHVVTHEEVLLLLAGELHAVIDDRPSAASVGDVLRVPAGSTLRIDTTDQAAAAWVVTCVGLEAVVADGSRVAPPWAR